MNKRELNKKLSSTLLQGNDGEYIRDIHVRVNRARVRSGWGRDYTEADITVWAEIKSVHGEWRDCHTYGPRDSRNFLRRNGNLVSGIVNDWTRLWGFPTSDLKLKTIKFGLSPNCTGQHPPRRRYYHPELGY
jgi:hypothetical protein